MPESASRVIAITAGTNRVTGVDHIVIEYQDGTQQVHAGPWSEARELADRAGARASGGRPGWGDPLEPARHLIVSNGLTRC
jgi:hypothetical protein